MPCDIKKSVSSDLTPFSNNLKSAQLPFVNLNFSFISAPTCNNWEQFRSGGPAADTGERDWRATSPQCRRAACSSHAGCRYRTQPGFLRGRQGGTCWHVRRRSLLMMSHCFAAVAAAPRSLSRQKRTLNHWTDTLQYTPCGWYSELMSVCLYMLYISSQWCRTTIMSSLTNNILSW